MGGEHQRIEESLNRVHREDLVMYIHYTRANDDVKRCHHCSSEQHLIRDCEQAKINQNTQENRANFQTMRVSSVHLQPSRENLD